MFSQDAISYRNKVYFKRKDMQIRGLYYTTQKN